MAELTLENAKELGWATERTLQSLLASGRQTEKLVDAIGKKYFGSEAALREAMGDLKAAVGDASSASIASSSASESTARRLAEENENYTNAMKSLQGSLLNGFTRLMDAGDTNSLLGGVSSSFSGAASSLKFAGERGQQLGKYLGHAATALDVFIQVLNQVTVVADSMRKLYAGGALMLDGFTGLAEAAGQSGVRVAQFAEILSKHGRVAVTLGTRATVDLTRQFQRMTNFGGNLMMTQSEGMEAFMETLEIMRESGEMQGLSQGQIAVRGTALLKTFNDLAIATGRNRNELRKQTDEIMRQPLTSLMSRLLPPESRQRLTDFTANMAAQFGSQANVLTTMVERVAAAGGGFGLIDENMRPLLSIIPGFGQALQHAANNNLSGAERTAALARVFDNLGERGEEQLRMLARSNPALAAQVEQILQMREQSKRAREQLEGEARARGMTVDALKAEREETERRLQELTGALNRSNAAVARLGMAFTKVAAALGPVLMPILDGLSWGLNHVSSVVETFADVIAPIADVVGPALGLFGTIIGTAIDSVIDLVKGFFSLRPVVWTFSSIAGTLRLFGDGIKMVSEIIRDTYNGVKEFIGNLFGGTIGDITGVIGVGLIAYIGVKAMQWMLSSGMGMLGSALGSILKIPGLALGGAGGALGKIFGGITSAFSSLFKSVGTIISSGAGMIGKAISALGSMLAGVARGIGSTIGGLLEGLGKGLSSIGTPQVLLGVGALAGLAGTVWLAGKAFAAFAEVKWEDMGKAALAIVGLGAAAAGAGALAAPIALGGAALGAAIAAIGGAMIIAGEGLKQLREINIEDLGKAALAIVGLGAAAAGAGAMSIPIALGGAALGAAIAAIGGAMIIAGEGFKQLREINIEDLGKAGLAIVGLGAAAAGAGALAVPIAAGGVALGAAIGAIGLAIGGAAWLMGESMERLTTGLERLSAIDGNGLVDAARGMSAVGLALLGMTGANIASGLGGLVSGILGFFQADPIEKLRRLAELGQPLMVVSDAISQLAEAMERLSRVNFGAVQGLSEIINLSRNINDRNLANLARVTGNPQFIQTVQNIAQASQVTAPQAAPPVSGPAEPIIATAELNRRTIEYYDQSLLQFARMNELLEMVSRGVTESRDANVTGMREVSEAIRSRGRIN